MNIGSIDKMIRLLTAIILSVLFFKQLLPDSIALLLLLIVLWLTATVLFGISPIYRLLKIDTRDDEKEQEGMSKVS